MSEERFAAIQHGIWSHWMRWFFENDTPENRERWRRQMETPYEALSEREKESDRKVVREFMGAELAEVARLQVELAELRQLMRKLLSYTEACEGMLNASPAGQVLAAREALRSTPDTPEENPYADCAPGCSHLEPDAPTPGEPTHQHAPDCPKLYGKACACDAKPLAPTPAAPPELPLGHEFLPSALPDVCLKGTGPLPTDWCGEPESAHRRA